MKPVTTWILIANGARARVLEHKSNSTSLKAIKGMEFSDEALSISDIMADKAGRAFASVGASRSAMVQRTDPVAKREADFINLVADNLNKKYVNNGFDRLVIFAAHNAMGDLRKALSVELNNAIIAEIPKDLTKVPNNDIAKHLKDVLLV